MTPPAVQLTDAGPHRFLLNMHSVHLTDAQFGQLCRDNPDLRLELTADKELVVMTPAGSKTGWRNARFTQGLANWAEEDGTGLCFDSSAGFSLPNGAKRSPDASWINRKRWEALTEEQQEGFAPICPDFVMELRSPVDSLPLLHQKMEEYLASGAQLGWLIDPREKTVYLYRPNRPAERLESPETISAAPVLPGFVFDVRDIW